MYKIGNSVDIHKLVKNKPLYMGGIKIPSDKGSLAHSDGDAILHCLSEAIMGALNIGDLGHNFPNNNPEYKDKRSTYFLKFANDEMKKQGYHINNIDIMVVIEKPKLEEYKYIIRDNIATLLGIESKIVSIKAGTNEKIGKIGKNKAYLAWCTVLLEK